MFSYYPRPQPAYYQPSPYARALAQQQQQQRARAQQLEQERLLAQQRASRYFPDGYDYEPDEEDDSSSYYYYTPRQRALLEAQRRQEALEQRKRDAAARALHERAAMKQEQPVEALPIPKSPSPPPSTAQPPASTPTPTPSPPSPSPSPSPPSPELLNAAATKIQSHYRTHRALLTISSLLTQFEALKREFVPPTTIDYQSPSGGVVSVAVPPSTPPLPQPTGNENATANTTNAKLAYTPTNRPLHTYTELLARLLVSLDAVESRGSPVVRERRRAAVRRVEGEAGRVEGIWRGVWATHLEEGVHHQEEEREEEGEVEAMVVEPTPELTASDSETMVVEEERATPELTASTSDSDSDSDSEQDLPTPVTTPIQSPHLLPLPEFKEDGDGVVVGRVHPGEEKEVEDFVVV